MKLVLIQPELKPADVCHNYQTIEEKINAAIEQKPDVIALPEMWNTSFFPDNVNELADKNGQRTKEFLSKLAKEHKVNIVGGSVCVSENDKIYNRCYVYNRDGELLGKYDKVHLFSPSGEDKRFQSGDKIFTFELDGEKCGVCICYDLRFLEWIRMNALEGIKILFLPAAWPAIRNEHWDTLNKARAIENQMFVACINSIGKAGSMEFGGHSAIIDPWGVYIAEPKDGERIVSGDIDFSVIKDIRNSINVFNDRKKHLYKF